MLIPGCSFLSWKAHNARILIMGSILYLVLLVLVSFPLAIPLTDYKAVISPIAAICTLPGLVMFSQSFMNPFDSLSASARIRIFVGFVTYFMSQLGLIYLLGGYFHTVDTTLQSRNFLIMGLSLYLAPMTLRGYYAAGVVQFSFLSWILGSREPVPEWSVFFLPHESTLGLRLLALIAVCCVVKLCVETCRFLVKD